jgi:pyruvate/2-oxoglutarate dehydrogenase complex dihydrolipoamide acyltransferase (E2) component
MVLLLQGLVVPVLRNVHSMSYADIEKGMAALAVKARDGNLAVEDMDGGTFTISNGGVFGSLYGTPIINPPQSAILGMHAIVERPVARNGQVSAFLHHCLEKCSMSILICLCPLLGGDSSNDVCSPNVRPSTD